MILVVDWRGKVCAPVPRRAQGWGGVILVDP